jgi:hypothetical protein
VEGENEHNIGYWFDPPDAVSWLAKITKAGPFKVEIIQACPGDTAGTEYALKIGEPTLHGTVAASDGWQVYRTVPLGQVEIPQSGTITVRLTPSKPKGLAVMNLRAVVLTPVTP